MATTLYSKTIRERAEALVAKSDTWAEGVRNSDGVRFILFASNSRSDVYYMTRLDGAPGGCTCPRARLGRKGICSHLIAAQIVFDRAQEEAAKPKMKYEDLFENEGWF